MNTSALAPFPSVTQEKPELDKPLISIADPAIPGFSRNLTSPVGTDVHPVIRRTDVVSAVSDKREMVPNDLRMANHTLAEESLRTLLKPNQDWMKMILPSSTDFPPEVQEGPFTTHLDQWMVRMNIIIPPELSPVIKKRILQSVPGSPPGLPADDWIMSNFHNALTYLSKTGSKKDGQKATTLMKMLRADGHAPSRAGTQRSPIIIGNVTQCIDYSSQPLSVGFLHWIGVDFGDQLSLNNHLRNALPEPDKKERNQCVAIHLAAAYEWYLQGCPERPLSASRVQTSAQQIRQTEYQEALGCSKEIINPDTRREFELLAAVHDVLNDHHGRGFEDLNSFQVQCFTGPTFPWWLLKLILRFSRFPIALWYSQIIMTPFVRNAHLHWGYGIIIHDSYSRPQRRPLRLGLIGYPQLARSSENLGTDGVIPGKVTGAGLHTTFCRVRYARKRFAYPLNRILVLRQA